MLEAGIETRPTLRLDFVSYRSATSEPHQIGNYKALNCSFGGARGVMVIVIGNGHGDTSSNPGRG